jgi:Asp-tRNA(Asn)/Glu-tRNA(Gln) amidotransferase A subunit family amidase
MGRTVGLRLARAIRARRISAVELVGECAARIEAANPTINVVVSLRLEEALLEARKTDDAITRGDEPGRWPAFPCSSRTSTTFEVS